jgi:hypothetical protein
VRRSDLKRRIYAGRLSAAEVILDCPAEASRWPVARLLASQPQWGDVKSRYVLARYGISEIKPIGELTQRQRHLIATELGRCSTTVAPPGTKEMG